MPTLAVLATIPGREEALARCLASLRPQVDELRVICHGVDEAPRFVTNFADRVACEPDRFGSAAKLRWAREWRGLYLGCDDDLLYPVDYVATMARWVKRWKGRALCAIGGRLFSDHGDRYPADAQRMGYPVGGNAGAWINYPNAAGLAFDTRLQVPSFIPEKNQEEAYLAIWAQRHAVPIWLVPKRDHWVKWLLDAKNPGPTIWEDEKGREYPERNRLIREPAGAGWTLPKFWGSAHPWPPSAEPFAGAEVAA